MEEILKFQYNSQFQCDPLGFRTKIYFVFRAEDDHGNRCSGPKNIKS